MKARPVIRAHVGPNMTPMVDVVMCILIFFMLGSSFLLPEKLFRQDTRGALELPPDESRTIKGMPSVRMVIRIFRQDGATWVRAFDANPMKVDSIDALKNAGVSPMERLFVAKGEVLSPDVQVLICPENAIPYQDIISVYECCVKAKLRQVAFAQGS